MSQHYDKTTKLWIASVRVEGKQKFLRNKTWTTKKAAKAGEDSFLVMQPSNTDIRKRMTFALLVDAFIEYKKIRTEESSTTTWLTQINNNILPTFGEKQVNEIQPLDILRWQNSIIDAGFSDNYKRSLFSILNAIFSFGVKFMDLEKNPMDKTDSFSKSKKKKEMDFYTVAEFKKLFAAVPEDNLRDQVLLLLFYYLGIRRGEMSSLQFGDIDLKNCTLSISKTMKRSFSGKKMGVPKTQSSISTLAIPDGIMPYIVKYFDWCKDYYPRITKTSFLFAISEPFAFTTMDRVVTNYENLAGLRHIRLHDFRHSTATYYLSIGYPIEIVKEIMRHKSIRMTEIYLHVDKDRVNSALRSAPIF